MKPMIDEPELVEQVARTVPVQYRGGARKGQTKLPQVLKDMRAVYQQNKQKDTPQQKPLRRMLEKSPDKFVSQLMSMERQHKSARIEAAQKQEKADAEGPEQAAPEEDLGEERCVELLGRLLREEGWNTQKG